MHWLRLVVSIAGVLWLPDLVRAEGSHAPLTVAPWSVAPFVLLLLAIAGLPLLVGSWWHHNVNKAIVGGLLALPVAAYLAYLHFADQQPALEILGLQLFEYVSFIALLASLFVVSGGIVLDGGIRATPGVNTAFLGIGVVLANFIGTTGASMLLIRPLLRTNQQRQRTSHLPIFFIFTVSNLGGVLTPLGDPPLFLGYLNGVPFAWTLRLWPQWLVANGFVLILFYLWDSIAYARERPEDLVRDETQIVPLKLRGTINFLLLAGIILSVLVQSWVPGRMGHALGIAGMVTLALLSLLLTPKADRAANEFTWDPIVEVAVLFAGIFVTMIPALELLRAHGQQFGLTQPWQYFWLTGALSSFLDNAPTYLVFAAVAAGPDSLGTLAQTSPDLLAAISCGAVFMGANTYIGNGPNFMVKSIADAAGYRTPSFFAYMALSGVILLPLFGLITILFFPGR